MTPDPNLWAEIPQEVKDAALLLGNYFKKQGIDDWDLYDVCSRKSLDNLENQVKNLETRKAIERIYRLNNMKYKYDKKNLADAFKNLAVWVENLDAKSNKDVIDATWDRLESLMEKTQEDHCDIFGTEGYEFSIMGKD
jgi:hypothetical protein